MAGSYFVPNHAGIYLLAHAPNEPVYKDLLRRTLRVEVAAKALAPVKSGKLKASITHRIIQGPSGLMGIVGTLLAYASYVNNGQGGGRIYPVTKKELYWPGAAHPVASVRRPARAPKPFLTAALAAAGGPSA